MAIYRLVLVLLLLSASLVAQRPGQATQPRGAGQVTPPRAGVPPNEEAPRGTAILRGVVLAADTGTPIRRAQVRASAPGARSSRLATTDAQGRFEFKELVAGRYTLTASKGGFVGLQYGQRRPSESGTPLDIADGQTAEKIVIALPRGSVISGRISDEFGEPVANAAVTAMRYGYSAGGRRYLPAGGQNSRDTTDDQGQFRLFGLPPGEYVLSANFRGGGGEVTDPSGEPSGYAPTYFPGISNIGEAQRVRVEVSQEQSNINFALIATKLVKLSGTVINSQGAMAGNAVLMLVPPDRSGGPMMAQATARVDRSGVFRFTDVAPGRYVLQARLNPGGGPAGRGGRGGAAAPGAPGATAATTTPVLEFARMEIAVGNDDVEGLVVVTGQGGRASGTVVIDRSDAPPFRADQVQVGARPTVLDQTGFGGAGANARLADDWTFQMTGLLDGRLFRASGPQGWTLKQVTLNGQDITDTPLEFAPGQNVTGLQIVLTDKQTTVTGSVTDDRNRPVVDATVVVFPADEKLWAFQSRFIRAARPDQEGRYEIKGLPAYEDYLIAVVQNLEDGQAGDPEFLASIKAMGGKLALKEGETRAADVKLSGR